MADPVSVNVMNVRSTFFSHLLWFDFLSQFLSFIMQMLAAACKSRGGKPKNGHEQNIIIKSYYKEHIGTENNQMDPIALGSPWQLKRNVWIYMVFLVYYDTRYPQNSLWDRQNAGSKQEQWQASLWDVECREMGREKKRRKGACGWHRGGVKGGPWHCQNSLYFLHKMLPCVLKNWNYKKKVWKQKCHPWLAMT